MGAGGRPPRGGIPARAAVLMSWKGVVSVGGTAHDVACPGALGDQLELEADLLALLEGIEFHVPALAAMEEDFLAVHHRDESEAAVLHHLLHFPVFHHCVLP